MKFLQICMDLSWTTRIGGSTGNVPFGVSRRVGGILQRNEFQLGRGRSLERPQNKRSAAIASLSEEKYAQHSFIFLLRNHYNMSPALQRIVCYAVALLNSETGFRPREKDDGKAAATCAMASVQQYVNSLGRYGTTAFLLPLFGACEINQAFCRLCAVHGGVYILREETHAVVIESLGHGAHECRGVLLKGGRFVKCDWLVVSPDHLPIGCPRTPAVRELRGIFLLKKPLLSSGQTNDDPSGCCVIAHIPPWTAGIRNVHTVHVLQMGSATNACPGGLYVLHILTSDNGHWNYSPYGVSVIRRTLRLLLCAARLSTDECDVLWNAYFHRYMCTPYHGNRRGGIGCVDNVVVCTTPHRNDLHFSSVCYAAEHSFRAICPHAGFTRGFLPKVPMTTGQNTKDDELARLLRINDNDKLLFMWVWLGGSFE